MTRLLFLTALLGVAQTPPEAEIQIFPELDGVTGSSALDSFKKAWYSKQSQCEIEVFSVKAALPKYKIAE